jgi:endonuclease YncB( thermonuclease family)
MAQLIKMELQSATDKTPKFTMNGKVVDAKIVSVHDGDSVHAVFEMFGTHYNWVCRIAHVDTPEVTTKNIKEKEFGLFVRDKLRELIMNKIVKLNCLEFDKYGRLLVEISVPDLKPKVHEWLIDNKYAYTYEGKTKQKWFEEK